VSKIELLPKEHLVQTSRVDHADWNYRPLLAYVMRRRFSLIRSLLPKPRVHRMLEVGFGSGVFMPELSRNCDELYGIDVHDRVQAVQQRLQDCGVHAALSQQDAAKMNFPAAFFDVIVSVSALEFIDRIEDAASELARVMTPMGYLVAVMPRKSPTLDFALSIATGEDAKCDYGGRRERVVPVLLQYFRIVRRKSFAGIYEAYAMQRIL
jgi:ubiquinone/menaquinone biosynthesis C-methylase UbiE